jgi:hypothetical protein
MEKAPKGFNFPEYTLTEPEDKRKTNPKLDKLLRVSEQVGEMQKRYTKIRTDAEEKITELQKSGGFEQLKSDMTEVVKQLNEQMLPTIDEIGKTLMRYKDVVYAVTDRIDTLPVTKEEERNQMKAALNKFNSPEISDKVMETFDKMLAEFAASEAKIKKSKELNMWHPSEKLREQIKKEDTASKTAGIKEMIMGFISTLKDIWNSLSEKVADFFVAKEEADPIVDEMERLLAETDSDVAQASINVISLMNKINSMKV